MGMYRPSGDRPELPSFTKRTRGPAAWGGIGCVMAVLLPVLAYFAALLTLEYNVQYHWFAVPPDLAARPHGLPVSWAILILTVGYAVLFYGLYSALYALMYRAAGITPYTVLDVERPERRRKRISQQQVSALGSVVVFLLALVGGIALVRMDLTHGWVTIPPNWRVPGPVPYAGVYVFGVLALWAVLWSLWGVVQGLISWSMNARRRDEEER